MECKKMHGVYNKSIESKEFFLWQQAWKPELKFCPVGAELSHADRHDDASSGFSQFRECVL